MVKHRGAVLLTDEIDERWLDLMSEAGLNMLGVHEIVSEEVNCVQRMLSRLEGGVRKTLGKFENSGIEICYELHAMEWLSRASGSTAIRSFSVWTIKVNAAAASTAA